MVERRLDGAWQRGDRGPQAHELPARRGAAPTGAGPARARREHPPRGDGGPASAHRRRLAPRGPRGGGGNARGLSALRAAVTGRAQLRQALLRAHASGMGERPHRLLPGQRPPVRGRGHRSRGPPAGERRPALLPAASLSARTGGRPRAPPSRSQATPSDEPRSIERFYDESRTTMYELMWWHSLRDDASPLAYVTALHLAQQRGCRRYLDFGAGVGSGGILFARHGFDVTLADISSTLLQFTSWRLGRRESSGDVRRSQDQSADPARLRFRDRHGRLRTPGRPGEHGRAALGSLEAGRLAVCPDRRRARCGSSRSISSRISSRPSSACDHSASPRCGATHGSGATRSFKRPDAPGSTDRSCP